jgi:hypothetical protein
MDRNKKGQTATGDLMEGFCGISRRQGLKPIIAAVNGYAFGRQLIPRKTNSLCRWWIRDGCKLVLFKLALFLIVVTL